MDDTNQTQLNTNDQGDVYKVQDGTSADDSDDSRLTRYNSSIARISDQLPSQR